jgi:hypothetical protein
MCFKKCTEFHSVKLRLKYICVDYYWIICTLKERGGWWILALVILSLCNTIMRYTTRYARIPVGTGKCVRQLLRAADVPSADHVWPAGCALLSIISLRSYLISIRLSQVFSVVSSGFLAKPCVLFSAMYAVGFLGSFAKLPKAPVSFVMSVCLPNVLFYQQTYRIIITVLWHLTLLNSSAEMLEV